MTTSSKASSTKSPAKAESSIETVTATKPMRRRFPGSFEELNDDQKQRLLNCAWKKIVKRRGSYSRHNRDEDTCVNNAEPDSTNVKVKCVKYY